MKEDVITLAPGDKLYPDKLIDFFGGLASPSIRAIGELALLSNWTVGFCGSRRVSDLGMSIAAKTASELAHVGVTIVSGYAKGVDTTTHRAALHSDGTTMVVLPEGIRNFRVKSELAESWDWNRALVLSQFADNAVWRPDRAMERNDLIVLLSMATIVIEAGSSGGTLNAGMKAIKYGRPLFVVNYQNYSEENIGNRILIESGGIELNYNKKKSGIDIDIILEKIHHLLI